MDNSADMSLTDRSFDESEMEFSFNDKNTVDVTVLLVEEDYDFEKSYNEYKNDGLIVTKNNIEYYRLFENDMWLIHKI